MHCLLSHDFPPTKLYTVIFALFYFLNIDYFLIKFFEETLPPLLPQRKHTWLDLVIYIHEDAEFNLLVLENFIESKQNIKLIKFYKCV